MHMTTRYADNWFIWDNNVQNLNISSGKVCLESFKALNFIVSLLNIHCTNNRNVNCLYTCPFRLFGRVPGLAVTTNDTLGTVNIDKWMSSFVTRSNVTCSNVTRSNATCSNVTRSNATWSNATKHQQWLCQVTQISHFVTKHQQWLCRVTQISHFVTSGIHFDSNK